MNDSSPQENKQTPNGAPSAGEFAAPALPTRQELLPLIGSATLLLFIVGGLAVFTLGEEGEDELVSVPPPPSSTLFDEIELSAEATFVYDIKREEVLFEKNAEAQLPLASLTKLMTAVLASERLLPDDVVVINQEALAVEGESGLSDGEVWKVKDLLDFTLLVSSNDGARALAAAAGVSSRETEAYEDFVDNMNAKARVLSLAQTYYLNETGLDTNEEISGGYGSARDMALLLSFALAETPHILEATRHGELAFTSNETTHEAENTNESIGSIPGLIGGKTGFTDLAGGNLAVVFDAGLGEPIAIVVLGSTKEGRFTDVERLVEATLASRESTLLGGTNSVQ